MFKALWRLIGILLLVGVVAAAIGSGDDDGSGGGGDGSSGSAGDDGPSTPSTYVIQAMGETFVKRGLKAPSTADFESFPEVRGDHARGLYSVIGQVDAQNGFGAMIRNDYVVIMENVCRDYYSPGCWRLVKLGVGDRMIVNRAMPEAESARRSASAGSSAADRGYSVRTIQQGLAAEDFDPGPADGIMGPRTRAAIRAYQRARGLDVTGEPSRALQARLEGE